MVISRANSMHCSNRQLQNCAMLYCLAPTVIQCVVGCARIYCISTPGCLLLPWHDLTSRHAHMTTCICTCLMLGPAIVRDICQAQTRAVATKISCAACTHHDQPCQQVVHQYVYYGSRIPLSTDSVTVHNCQRCCCTHIHKKGPSSS